MMAIRLWHGGRAMDKPRKLVGFHPKDEFRRIVAIALTPTQTTPNVLDLPMRIRHARSHR
jgi:hypothetical protein